MENKQTHFFSKNIPWVSNQVRQIVGLGLTAFILLVLPTILFMPVWAESMLTGLAGGLIGYTASSFFYLRTSKKQMAHSDQMVIMSFRSIARAYCLMYLTSYNLKKAPCRKDLRTLLQKTDCKMACALFDRDKCTVPFELKANYEFITIMLTHGMQQTAVLKPEASVFFKSALFDMAKLRLAMDGYDIEEPLERFSSEAHRYLMGDRVPNPDKQYPKFKDQKELSKQYQKIFQEELHSLGREELPDPSDPNQYRFV